MQYVLAVVCTCKLQNKNDHSTTNDELACRPSTFSEPATRDSARRQTIHVDRVSLTSFWAFALSTYGDTRIGIINETAQLRGPGGLDVQRAGDYECAEGEQDNHGRELGELHDL
jgi:hypothetical protein